MSRATLQHFLVGVEHPTEELLRGLHTEQLHLVVQEQQSPLHRLSHHAEVRLKVQDRELLLALPLHDRAERASYEVARQLKRIAHIAGGGYEVIPDALRYCDALGREQRCALVAEWLPEGEPLSEHFKMGCPAKRVERALRNLSERLQACGVAHNNLKAENIYLTPQGEARVVRPHLMRFSGASREDEEALEALIRQAYDYDLGEEMELMPTPPEKMIAVGPLTEGLMRICDRGLYGFMNEEGEVVIAPQFLVASDFREGRSVVESHEGMGVIDKRGAYIVQARFDGVDYDDMQGTIRVKVDDGWMLLDYSGNRIGPHIKE